jgi:hypothetical protein
VPNPNAGIVPDPPRSGSSRYLRLLDCSMIFLPVTDLTGQPSLGFKL